MMQRCLHIIVVTVMMVLMLPTTSQVSHAQTPELLLFGGKNRNTFLGCLNCSRFDTGSVCNQFGDQGSRFNSESIWNRFGEYGSQFSAYSPWNRFASDPPVIVDREGNFYGYFTSNRTHKQRTTIGFFLVFLDNADEVNDDLQRARDLFCDR